MKQRIIEELGENGERALFSSRRAAGGQTETEQDRVNRRETRAAVAAPVAAAAPAAAAG